MNRSLRWAKGVALVILILVGLYGFHFTARINIAGEHVPLSRAASMIPFSEAVGDFMTCTYGRFWNVECADPDNNEAWQYFQSLNVPDLPQLDIRYLCAADTVRKSFACSDRNMVGVAAMLTVLAALLAAVAIAYDASRLPDRRSAKIATVRYGLCAAACLLMLWLFRLTATTIWMGTIEERVIATSPILSFTGSMIGYALLVAMAAIGIVGAVSAATVLVRS